MNKTTSLYTILTVLAILLLPSVFSATENLDYCKQSGWVSGTTYYLTRDLGPTDLVKDSCFTITGNDVTLDCNGYSITGNKKILPNLPHGVRMTTDGNIVRNCEVSGFNSGIIVGGYTAGFSGRDHNTILWNTVYDNTFGILLNEDSDFSLISYNIVTDSRRNGFFLGYGSQNNTINNNSFCSNGPDVSVSGVSSYPTTGTSGMGNTFTSVYRNDNSPADDWPVLGRDYQECNQLPVAVDDVATTPVNIPITLNVLQNDFDLDGDSIAVTGVSAPSHGGVILTGNSVTYISQLGFTGQDSFNYFINDGNGGTDTGMVTVTITPAGVNQPPVAVNQNVNAIQNTAKLILLQGTDADGTIAAYTIETLPVQGTLTGTAPSMTYTPNTNFVGQDSFTFKVTDDDGAVSNIATITIMVAAPGNQAPAAISQTVDTTVNTSKNIVLQGTDSDGTIASYTIKAQPIHGTLTGTAPTLAYMPAAGFVGDDLFTFTVTDNDGVESNIATVTIHVFFSTGDADGDGFLNGVDNCPLVANPTQIDSDADGIGDACDTAELSDEEQRLQDLEDEFDDLDNDYDNAKDDYREARNDDDENDLDNAKEDLEDIKDDLDNLEDDLSELEDDIKDNDDLENQDDLLDRVDSLQEDIDDLRDNIDDVLGTSGRDDELDALVQAYDYSTPSAKPKTSSTQDQVVITIPPSVPAKAVASDWQKVRPLAWAMAGVIVLLALVVFATGVLAIKMKKGRTERK